MRGCVSSPSLSRQTTHFTGLDPLPALVWTLAMMFLTSLSKFLWGKGRALPFGVSWGSARQVEGVPVDSVSQTRGFLPMQAGSTSATVLRQMAPTSHLLLCVCFCGAGR